MGCGGGERQLTQVLPLLRTVPSQVPGKQLTSCPRAHANTTPKPVFSFYLLFSHVSQAGLKLTK